MKIEKLPSGSYRVRKMHNGERYSLTFDRRPTKAQIEEELQVRVRANCTPAIELSFREAATLYSQQKSRVLSPKTVFEYEKMVRVLPRWFSDLNLYAIGQVEVNRLVNELAANNAPKTVRNKHGFVSAVLRTYRPELQLHTSMPQKKRTKIYIPSDEDVRLILEELRGSMFYVPIVLACFGMRRSEILALRPEDIEKTDAGYVAHITRAFVQTGTGWVEKANKTTESERDLPIPSEVAELILMQGYVYQGSPNSITCKLSKVEHNLGIPHFSLHKLRHYFASKLLTITDAQTAQALGGWKTDAVMKMVYAHALEEEKEKARSRAISVLAGGLFS